MDGLKVYSEPRTVAAILARLSLHQKVYCYKIERAYAYVKVEETELLGWVDKARLISRLPPQPVSAPQEVPEKGRGRGTDSGDTKRRQTTEQAAKLNDPERFRTES